VTGKLHRWLAILAIGSVACSCAGAWAAPPAEEAPGRWTLFYEVEGTGTEAVNGRGQVDFVLSGESPTVDATGPLTAEGAKFEQATGKLIIRGSVENGVLTFAPDCELTISTSKESEPLDLFANDRPISIRLLDGAQKKKQTVREGSSMVVTWRIGRTIPPSCALTITAPADGHRVAFSTDRPGELTLDLAAETDPPELESSILWSLPAFGSSTRVTLEPENRRGPRLHVTLSGLPGEPSGLGPKGFTASVDAGDCHARAERVIELLPPREKTPN
jgi:hypothetical protein